MIRRFVQKRRRQETTTMSANVLCLLLMLTMTTPAPVHGLQKDGTVQEDGRQPGSSEAAGNEAAEDPTGVETPPDAEESEDAQAAPDIQPRLVLRTGSVKTFLGELERSRCGVFVHRLGDIFFEAFAESAESLDPEEAEALFRRITEWPDSPLEFLTFAPDIEGRARWAVRLGWPIDDLYKRVKELLESEGVRTILEDVRLGELHEGTAALRIGGELLAVLRASGAGSEAASHADLPTAPSPRTQEGGGAERGPDESPPLLTCRFDLTGTEKDTGATFLSQFSAVTAVEYEARVGEQGEWAESVRVHWPPISGLGAKMFVDRVKRTFFVPDEAFGALVMGTGMAPAMLDGMAGFGAQMMTAEPGRMEIVGEAEPGPIARHLESTVCVTVLPGTGFLPMPDVVIQGRTRSPEGFVAATRKAIEKANRIFREREQREPWREVTVRDRTVFYSEGGGTYRGLLMPVVMRPVLFVTRELDGKGRERDILVVAFTSTSPENLVGRWLDLPRSVNRRYLPTRTRTDGQLWVDAGRVYRWVHPYLNVWLSAMNIRTLLPYADEVSDRVGDALVTLNVGYTGLTARSEGPVPAGVVVIPTMVTASMEPDGSGGSDLARERLACQRLRVLYHHCKLFRQDHGRWPAEIRELEGYVDFAGHPELLRLRVSSRQRWRDWFEGIFQAGEERKPDEDEEDEADIDDGLYAIEWGTAAWTLGYAPGKLEHLEKLYIDQDGIIHRVPKQLAEVKEEPPSEKSEDSNEEEPDDS